MQMSSKIKKAALALICLLSFGCVSVYSPPQEQRYELIDVDFPSSMYQVREELFAQYFGTEKLDLGENGLFVFYEHDGLQKLFVVGDSEDGKIRTYQLPPLKLSPLASPEEYIRSRSELVKAPVKRESCMAVWNMDEKDWKELDSLKIQYMSLLDGDWSVSDAFSNAILGFYQRENKRDYFYFRKIKENQKYWSEIFNRYIEAFVLLERMDVTYNLKDCR